MLNTTSYYFYQKYETRSGSTTIPVLPITYSLDADGTMPLAVRKVDDQECGATPVQYRWVNMDVDTNYICDGYDKYYKQKKQQSTDGQTWTDVSPAEYRRGDLYQTNSPDCGYVTGYIFTGTCAVGQEVFTMPINNTQVQSEKIADGQWGIRYNNALTNLNYGFGRVSGLTSVYATSIIDTSRVTDLAKLFNGRFLITSIDLSNFVTSACTTMNFMFQGCSQLANLDISSFNTSNVTDMGSMFSGCYGLTSLDVTHFDTSHVTDFNNMFYYCGGITSLDVSNFVTSACTNMAAMFQACWNLTTLDLSNFDTSNVTDFGLMFYGSWNLTSLNLSNFDTSKATKMRYMFYGCTNLQTLNLSSFDFTLVSKYEDMFHDCTSLRTIYCSATNKSWIQARIAEAGLTQSINYIIL